MVNPRPEDAVCCPLEDSRAFYPTKCVAIMPETDDEGMNYDSEEKEESITRCVRE